MVPRSTGGAKCMSNSSFEMPSTATAVRTATSYWINHHHQHHIMGWCKQFSYYCPYLHSPMCPYVHPGASLKHSMSLSLQRVAASYSSCLWPAVKKSFCDTASWNNFWTAYNHVHADLLLKIYQIRFLHKCFRDCWEFWTLQLDLSFSSSHKRV